MASSQLPQLELDQKQIRVLWILPDEANAPVRCRMTTVPLGSQHIALSYVWGDDDPAYRIELNGRPFYVRENLHNFLRHARTMFVGELLWIDAICIDQRNTRERNHQVRQMHQIYSSAQLVVSWLGCEDLDLEDSLPQESNTSALKTSSDTLEDFIMDKTDDEILDLLKTMSDLEYWNRLWIVPEVLGARRLQLLYGYQTLSWPDLSALLDYMDSQKDDLKKWRASQLQEIQASKMSTFVKQRMVDTENVHRYQFRSLLEAYGYNDCADQRDRVFALITLADDVNASQIDYREDAEALCVRILSLQKLSIIESCHFATYLMSVLGVTPWFKRSFPNQALARTLQIPFTVTQLQHPLRKKDTRWRQIGWSVCTYREQPFKFRPASFGTLLIENGIELFETIDLDARYTFVTARNMDDPESSRRIICIVRQFIWRASPELSIQPRHDVFHIPEFGLLHVNGRAASVELSLWKSLQIGVDIFDVTPVESRKPVSRSVMNRGFWWWLA